MKHTLILSNIIFSTLVIGANAVASEYLRTYFEPGNAFFVWCRRLLEIIDGFRPTRKIDSILYRCNSNYDSVLLSYRTYGIKYLGSDRDSKTDVKSGSGPNDWAGQTRSIYRFEYYFLCRAVYKEIACSQITIITHRQSSHSLPRTTRSLDLTKYI